MKTDLPHLVLLHAFPLNATMWDWQVASLSHVCHVHALDLPGFGREPALEPGSFTMMRAAEHVLAKLEALGIHRCVLGGLSMGGYVAFECIRLFSHRIEGLVLADTKATADTRESRIGRRASADCIRRGDKAGYLDSLVLTVLGTTTRSSEPALVEHVRGVMEEAPDGSIVDALLGMAQRRDSTDLLSMITVPTGLIFGMEDDITTLDDARAMDALIPEATLTIIPRAGHLSNLESPVTFNRAVLDVVSAVAARRNA